MSHHDNKMGYECNFMYELTKHKEFLHKCNIIQSLLLSCSPCSSFLHLCLSKTDLSLRIKADMIADFVADVFCL